MELTKDFFMVPCHSCKRVSACQDRRPITLDIHCQSLLSHFLKMCCTRYCVSIQSLERRWSGNPILPSTTCCVACFSIFGVCFIWTLVHCWGRYASLHESQLYKHRGLDPLSCLCHSNEGLFSDESIVYIANSLWVMLPLKWHLFLRISARWF